MLEEATAANASVAGRAEQGDAETASLREAWLAFGQLIRAADDSLPAMPSIAASIVPQKPRRRRWIGLIAAVAAALLVAVTFGRWIHRDGKPGNNGPSVAQAEKATSEQPKAGAFNPEPTATAKTAPTATNSGWKPSMTNTATWDDPLETQIATVSQQISNVEQNWQHRVDDVDLVQYRIDEVSDSLQNDKL